MMKQWLAYGAVSAVLAGCCMAEEIGIGVLSGARATESAFLQAQPGSVAKDGEVWNFITPGANGTAAVSSLKTTAGAGTEMSCAVESGYSTSNSVFEEGRNRDFCLMDSWAGFRGAESIVFSRLPGSMAEYCHVEIYGDCNETNRDMLYTVNGVAKTLQDRGTFSGNFEEGVNRAAFRYVPVTNGTLTITGNGASSSRSAVNAIRLTAPEQGIISFSAVPSAVMEEPGAETVLSWKTWKCAEVSLSTRGGGSIPVETANGAGSITLHPEQTTTYVLSAVCENGSTSTAEATVTVKVQEPEILSFTSDKKKLPPGSGEQATLAWSTVKARTLTMTANGADLPVTSVSGAGSVRVAPTETTVYTLTLTAADGTEKSKSLTISVLREDAPNILFFLVDDMGWQDTSVPFYYKNGLPVTTDLNKFYHTPSMERLAAQGTRFTNAYSCPVCTPGRTALMTGKTPARNRVSTWTALASATLNDELGSFSHIRAPRWNMAGMSHSEIPLPRVLQEAGYRTISVGKAHFAPNSEEYSDPTKIGFDVNVAGSGLGGPGSYRSDQNFMKSNAAQRVPGMEKYYTQGSSPSDEQKKNNFLTNALTLEMKGQLKQAVDDGVPFFAYMTHYAVHSTHEDPDPNGDYNLYDTLPPQQDGVSVNQGQLRNFATLIQGMDKSLGDLMDYLKELGVANRTLVIFMSDNGGDAPVQQSYGGNIPWIEVVGAVSPLRGRKCSRYEGGTRVPMIVGWAEVDPSSSIQQAYPIAQNAANHDIVAMWDFYPTILSMLKLKVPAEQKVDGEDISPYFRGDSSFHRTQKIYQHFPHRHTYANFYSSFREGNWKVIYNYMDQYAHTDLYSGNGYKSAGRFPWQLFNLEDDISESNDLAQDPAQKERLMRMARSLIRELHGADAQYPVLTRNGQEIGTAYIRMPDFPDADSDGDGVPDLVEDANGNGLLDPGETDPDDPSSVVPVQQ